MAEQLICNQQVVGSTPITSSIFLGVFPSGQRGQTVNLLSPTTVVRIHPLPPEKPTSLNLSVFQLYSPYGELYCYAVIFVLRQVLLLRELLRHNIKYVCVHTHRPKNKSFGFTIILLLNERK